MRSEPSTRRLRSALFDASVAACVAGLALLTIPRTGTDIGWVGVGMAGVLLFRRRYRLVVLAAVSLLALLQVLWFPGRPNPLQFDVAVLIAMYTVVKYAPRMRDGFLAAVPVAIGIAVEVARDAKVHQWWYVLLFYLAICVGTWLAGYGMRTRRLYIAGLEERARTAEREREHLTRIAVAQERASIARELHDVVAHSLAVMIVQADGATYAIDADREQARAALKQVAATGREALDDMRRLVGVLRDGESDTRSHHDDARERWPVTVDDLDSLLDRSRSAGVPVELTSEGQRPALPPLMHLTVYRIVQEGLTNVLRHAGAGATVRLRIRYEAASVRVEMIDDGGGRLATPARRDGGHGLVGMRERVAVHAGSFSAGPVIGGGWRVSAELPFDAAAPPNEPAAVATSAANR